MENTKINKYERFDNSFWEKVSKFWNFEKNKIEGNDDGSKEPWKQFRRNSDNIIWLNCDKIEYHIYPITCKDFNNGNRCCYCCISGRSGKGKVHRRDSFAQWVIDEFGILYFNKIIDHEKNKSLNIDIWNLRKRSLTKVWFNCESKDYHEYDMSCDGFYRGNRCKYCGRTKYVHKYDSLGYLYPQIFDIWSNKNKLSPYEYTVGTEKKIWLVCKDGIHEDYSQQVKNAIISEFRCPMCSQESNTSKLQNKINIYLNKMPFDIKTEHRCSILPTNPKTKYPLPFDNEIVDLKLIIEVHGRQHYEEVGENSAWLHELSPKEYLHKIKLHDRYKRIYAISLNYFYLEIPYWTNNLREEWKILINDKIKEILNNENNLINIQKIV